MASSGPLSGAELQHSPQEYAAIVEGHQPQLLELRTETGIAYLRPSRWERIRLQWAFRHFHILCPELLSPSNRRLIERLSRSAIVHPSSPVSRDAIFGVVEKALPATAKTGVRIQPVETWPESIAAGRAEAESPRWSLWQGPREALAAIRGLTAWPGHRNAFNDWKGLAALGAVCLAVILANVYSHIHSGTSRTEHPQTLAAPPPAPASPAAKAELTPPRAAVNGAVAVRQLPAKAGETQTSGLAAPAIHGMSQPKAPLESSPSVTSPAPSPGQFAQQTGVHEPAAAPATPPAASSPVPSERPLIAAFPRGSFPYPVLSNPNFVGKVSLKAVIGTDGSVKDVTVLSGDPKAAQAAASAVKQWHYSPDEVGGHAIEAETVIGISFFGQDAISVTSLR